MKNNCTHLEQALTKNCLQSGWSVLYSFPCCLQSITSLDLYFKNLNIGSIFACSDDSPHLIIRAVILGKNNRSIFVLSEREDQWSERLGFFPWNIIEITFVNSMFIHSKLGSYFEECDAKEQLVLHA